MATMPSIDVDVDLNLYVGLVRPGDKLVVAIGRQLDMATAGRIRELLEAKLPGVEIVPIEASALVVYRPS